MKKIRKVFYSIWFLALLIAIPVILFLPDVFDKYKVGLIKPTYFARNLFQTYHLDLNSDGKQEMIVSFLEHNNNNLSLHYLSESYNLIDQLNFNPYYINGLKKVFFADVNSNGYQEIYGFTVNNDSLFLNWFEPFPDTSGLQHVKFISEIGTFGDNQIQILAKEMRFIDITGDGFDDIVFPIGTGYSLKPRNIFVFDVQKDTVLKSDYLGINPDNLQFVDLDNDNSLEILFDNASSANLKDSSGRLHTDNRPWLYVLDSNINAVFKPISFSTGLLNQVKVFVAGEQIKNIVAFHFNESDTINDKVYLFSNKGVLLRTVSLPGFSIKQGIPVVKEIQNKFYVFHKNYCTSINSNLDIEKTYKLPVDEDYSVSFIADINGGFPEIILANQSGKKIAILTEKFKEKVELEFEEQASLFSDWNILGNNEFTVISSNNEYHYKLKKNKYYFLKFPIYLIVYLVSVGFVFFLQLIQTRQLQEKYELQNQVRDLELKSYQSQMDPHFMFNAFNSMATLLLKGDQQSAYNSFLKFSKMVRVNLENSNSLLRSLKEELEIVSVFLELNKLRFKEKLDYLISIDKSINNFMLVPKMIIQIHVENALKHGLRKKQDEGFILIELKTGEEFFQIIVEDNGIGREKAKKYNQDSTKKGLKMLDAIYDRLNSINKYKIKQTFEDLKSEGGIPIGTRVEILLPLFLKEM